MKIHIQSILLPHVQLVYNTDVYERVCSNTKILFQGQKLQSVL